MRILIVDDNKSVRSLIKQFLEPITAIVRECSDGSESLTEYLSFKPDWVLMDIDMPIMDGLAATRELKEQYPEVKVLIISQYDTPEYRSAALAVGASGYLYKDNLSQVLTYLYNERIGIEDDQKISNS